MLFPLFLIDRCGQNTLILTALYIEIILIDLKSFDECHQSYRLTSQECDPLVSLQPQSYRLIYQYFLCNALVAIHSPAISATSHGILSGCSINTASARPSAGAISSLCTPIFMVFERGSIQQEYALPPPTLSRNTVSVAKLFGW